MGRRSFLGRFPHLPCFPTQKFKVSISGRNRLSYSGIKIRNVSALPQRVWSSAKERSTDMQEEFNQLPQIDSRLRKNILRMPEAVFQASGIVINGRRIKSFVFTTDLAIIRNCDADAVFAVYPFTPQQAISDAIIKASYIPVFCGVGGGTTKGMRTVSLAKDVESQGAMGVVLNAPISDLNLLAVSKSGRYPRHCHRYQRGHRHCHAFRERRVDSEHCLRLQNAGGCAQNPGAIPAGAPDRLRRQDERKPSAKRFLPEPTRLPTRRPPCRICSKPSWQPIGNSRRK